MTNNRGWDFRSLTAFGAVAVAAVLAGGAGLDAALAAEQAKPEGIKAIYQALGKVVLDPSRSVTVENLQVGHDIMDITLVSGKLYFAKPWKEGANPTGAIFVGEGHAKFTPVNKIEAYTFKKGYGGKEALDEKFKHAFIRFNDSLYESLKDHLVADQADPDTVSLFEKRQKALEDLLVNLEFPIIQDLLGTVKRRPFRFVEFESEKEGWISYGHNPLDVEPNAIFRHKRVGFSDFQSTSLLSAWHDKDDYQSGEDLDKMSKDLFSIDHYDGDFTVLKQGMLLDAKVQLDLRPLVGPMSTALLDFVTYYDFAAKQKEFKIKSVTLPDGTPLDYIHSNYGLLVQFDKPVEKGETKSFVVAYTADFIRPNPTMGEFVPGGEKLPANLDALDATASTFTLLNTFPWFPQYGFLKRYSFDWRLKVPKPLLSVASGTTVKRWEEGDYNCLQTVEKKKVALASWLFGKYQIYTDEKDTATPRIYISALPKQVKQLQPLYQETRNVINWYHEWGVPYPYEELDIVQMGFFYGFGQAPPGLVQLTGETFLSQGEIADLGWNPTFKYAFVAHEVGHEWFGHVASWASYHDQWLSEAFTEYMSGMYVLDRNGEKAFETKLRQWRQAAEQVPDGGSIWLGQRSGKWYFNVTYFKGPYVLHMLRLNMQAQFGVAEGNRIFLEALKNFLAKYDSQNPSTNDWIAVVNQLTKKDYGPFFQQWFRDMGIPEINFSYTVRPTEDGKWLVTMKAVQTDKENPKLVVMPVGLKFGEKTITKMMAVSQQENTYQIKVPTKPDEVIPNLDEGALAKVKAEGS